MKGSLNVLVTGGAGFIGAHLVNALLAGGYGVVVLDNFRTGRIENISQHLKDCSFRLVKGDVRDKTSVGNAIKGVDAVIHLAALCSVTESIHNPIGTHEVNVTGTVNLIEKAVREHIRRFVLVSSASVYGDSNLPWCAEDSQLNPGSPYAASKTSAECYCSAFTKSYGLETVILRYFNVYGPTHRDDVNTNVVSTFLGNALSGKPVLVYGDGEQTRDFIYVEDAVNATALALESGGITCEVLNVCTGKPTTVNELVRNVEKITGKSLEVIYDKPRKGDIRNSCGDPAKAEAVLGFKARIGLLEGLGRCLAAMSSHGQSD